MAGVAGGQALGPLLDCSVLATRNDAVVGACLVIDKPGEPPRAGPWLLDVFRDLEDPARGIGSAMLAHAARSARSASLPAITTEADAGDERGRVFLLRLGFRPVPGA
jgi:GNAT superfamily N-acetyltransferase